VHRHSSVRAFVGSALLALAASASSAQNATAHNLTVSVSVAASCRVTGQPAGDVSMPDAADLVTLQCAKNATAAPPQVSSFDPPADATDSDEATHRVVTINF
jgi:hypothetical protein